MVKLRREVDELHCWDLAPLFPSRDKWVMEMKQALESPKSPYWPSLSKWRGKLAESADALKETLDNMFSVDRKLSKLYTFAHLQHDQDIGDEHAKADYEKAVQLLHDLAQEASWIDPEILLFEDAKLDAYIKDPKLSLYKFYLEKIKRQKPHTLSPDNEHLMALAGQAMMTAYKSFNALTDADFVFGQVADSEGKMKELTHGSFGLFLRSTDRELRKNAFFGMHNKFYRYQNTVAEMLGGTVQNHLFNARARHYGSCLEAALYPKNVPVEVYHSLIDTVHGHLGTLHRYIDLRKRVLELDAFHLYDAYVPLVPDQEITMTYDEAVEAVISSVAPLGKEYQDTLAKGLKEQRWVDRFENKNKRSGAYSSGCYDSHPYILMNYKNILRDVFTLSHEAGHSMHSYLSRRSQDYVYADYPIFVAEVASTFNEELLFQQLLKNAKTEEQKIYLINQKIEDIRGTFFRQTMFAEFELEIHQMAERGDPLTPEALKRHYVRLCKRYFGLEAVVDEHAEMEWARIPHFYYNFYVYQYATGISAALSLVKNVQGGGNKERDRYLSFLSSGGKNYPIELLRSAGVDMCTPAPVENTLSIFADLLNRLETSMENLASRQT